MRYDYTWGELQWLAQDHDDWRVLIGDLSPEGATGNDYLIAYFLQIFSTSNSLHIFCTGCRWSELATYFLHQLRISCIAQVFLHINFSTLAADFLHWLCDQKVNLCIPITCTYNSKWTKRDKCLHVYSFFSETQRLSISLNTCEREYLFFYIDHAMNLQRSKKILHKKESTNKFLSSHFLWIYSWIFNLLINTFWDRHHVPVSPTNFFKHFTTNHWLVRYDIAQIITVMYAT